MAAALARLASSKDKSQTYMQVELNLVATATSWREFRVKTWSHDEGHRKLNSAGSLQHQTLS